MALSPSQTSALEFAIQSALSRIPMLNEDYQHRRSKNQYQINNPDDFIFGFTMGFIDNAFHNAVILSQGRSPTDDEKQEAQMIILNRCTEIRNAISLRRYQLR